LAIDENDSVDLIDVEADDDNKEDDAYEYGLDELHLDKILIADEAKKAKRKKKKNNDDNGVEEEEEEEQARKKLSRRHTRQRTAQKLKIKKLIDARMRYVSSESIFDEKYRK